MPVRISKNRVALENIPLNEAATVIVASATSTPIGGAASNNVDISGATTITSFDTVAEGINRKGRFTGALTLTHNATSLILPGGVNITTAVNDRYEARSLGSGNWIVTKYQKADGTAAVATSGHVIQVKEGTPYATYATATAVFPDDDTIPQNTEGTEIISDCTITPSSATNRLKIYASIPAITAGSIPFNPGAGIFQDSIANALATGRAHLGGNAEPGNIFFTHEMVAGTTSAITFKLRYSACTVGITYINGDDSARKWGGTLAARLWVEEIKV